MNRKYKILQFLPGCGCCEWNCDVTESVAVVADTKTVVDDGAVFGEGCGTAAGAGLFIIGLIDELLALGDTAAPEFTFLPRPLCKKNKKKKKKH